MYSWKFWTAFAIGITSGTVIALLYAPQSGEQTRRQLLRSLEDAGDYLKETAGDVQGRAEDYVRRSRDVVEDLVDSARRAVRTY